MSRGKPNKRYTADFKREVVEAVLHEGLSYKEAERRYKVDGHNCIQGWERIYLTEGPAGFSVERRGQGGRGRPVKLAPKVEEDLLNEVQRLRAENDYLKNLHALVSTRVRRENGHK